MKKIYFFLFAFSAFYTFSQAPKLINYQGIVRSASGNPFTAPVKLRFEIFPTASGGTAAFSEIQSTSTNSLGLFSTQIGKNTALNLNWSTGSWFLEVSVDTTNSGSSFTTLGRQQMVSVPFALFAENAGSAPGPSVTFSNNILYVGTNSVAIPAPPVYNAGTGIAITSGTIDNTAPDQTVTITAAGNTSVMSAYPNFTVGSIAQVLSINNNSISLSNGGGTITLPATSTTPNTSLTASGIATVTASGTNTFNIAVASPSISGSGGTTVSGTYPNFLISSPLPVTPTVTGTGIATSSSAGNSFSVNVPGPALSIGGNVLTVTQGSATSNVVLPAPPQPSVTGNGVAVVTPTTGNSFTVNVPAPVLSIGGNAITVTQGTASSTALLPAPPQPSITGSGVAVVTPSTGNSFTVNVPGPQFTFVPGSGQLTLIQGSSSFNGNISPQTAITGSANTLSIGTSTVNLPFWSLNGNSNVLSGTNFLGTTNATDLIFRTNNTPRLSILSAGNVGIGTTSPTGDLNIFNSSQATIKLDYAGSTGFYISANSSAANILTYDNVPLNFGTTGINQMTLLQNGNFGIGTGAPIGRLHVRDVQANLTLESTGGGAALTSYDLKTSGAGTGSLYKFNTGRLALASGGGYNMQFLNSIGGSFQFDEGSNTRLYIATGGNIGVNTLSPANKFHVNGGVTITDGTEGLSKVLTSDATGNASWKPLTVVTTNAFNGKFASSISSTPSLLQAPLCSFTKGAADTRLEIVVQTALYVGDLVGTNSVTYEVRLNGTSPVANTGRSNYYVDNNNSGTLTTNQPATLIAEFPALATGTYNVEIWVWAINGGGTATNVYVDNGNFSASSVIIKEFR